MARLPLPGRGTGPRVVALGGGHGLAASLAALRLVVEDITAIVTVADNGGSSGRLRRDFDVLPPGDLRMALAALCDDSEWGHIWRDVLQHRFVGDGDLSGHALGNLLIVTLWQQHSDPVRGLDLVARLLGARGRVLPMASTPLQMRARVRGDDPARPDEVTEVAGQVEVARTPGLVESVAVEPADPEIPAETLAAIEGADWIVLGPGSWYTSVLPHLLVPRLREAVGSAPGRRALVLNLERDTSETSGWSAPGHLESLRDHAPDLRLDTVLADPTVVDDVEELEEACRAFGAHLVVQRMGLRGERGVHDPLRLGAAFSDLFA